MSGDHDEIVHLRRLVNRLVDERPLLVERSILACAGMIRDEMERQMAVPGSGPVLQALLDKLEQFDHKKILVD